ncbi:hypothetical protein SY88_03895 [Clostridiales bacterium PH28_bin88]|nr:hypothetical protein SY88_03895 [Clostridiales bacterium PH28_bin88]
MQIIKKAKVPELLELMAANAAVYVPAQVGGNKQYTRWEKGVEPALDGGNTVSSAKELFFPQTETMYCYCISANGMGASIEEAPAPTGKQVVFGIRPCDVRSLKLLDDVFLTRGYEDKFYKTRRENTVLVSLGCLEPQPTCFCDSLGINPAEAEGADVMMCDLGDAYGMEAKTGAGKDLLAACGKLLQDGSAQAPAAKPCTLRVEVDGLTEKLQKMFEHPIWASLCKKCINCGTCTWVCPTCHCFDINGQNRGDAGYKFRCWDSCMFSEYTQMAGGHNPRPSKKERVRQRFLHKLQYFPERYEEWGCVGCGRCLTKCPVILDITRFINDVREVALDA